MDKCCKETKDKMIILWEFFFDPELERCFTYLYEGCGGGRNTFYTESQCRNTCIPADKFTCGGNKKPTGTCSDRDMRCPFGSTCVIGALGVGLCCDSANERQWEYEIRQPPCRIGKILKRTVSHGEEVWIADKFVCGGNKEPTGSCKEPERSCPAGSTCVIGFGGGLCCDDANEKQWDMEARNPSCPVGNVLMRSRDYGPEAWIGKSCSHSSGVQKKKKSKTE
uniref:Proteinase inhibitor I2 domain containing protein n=1 Tax=Haemonchus contortus TaxID=6289 RepID=W6NB26_HAECO